MTRLYQLGLIPVNKGAKGSGDVPKSRNLGPHTFKRAGSPDAIETIMTYERSDSGCDRCFGCLFS